MIVGCYKSTTIIAARNETLYALLYKNVTERVAASKGAVKDPKN